MHVITFVLQGRVLCWYIYPHACSQDCTDEGGKAHTRATEGFRCELTCIRPFPVQCFYAQYMQMLAYNNIMFLFQIGNGCVGNSVGSCSHLGALYYRLKFYHGHGMYPNVRHEAYIVMHAYINQTLWHHC